MSADLVENTAWPKVTLTRACRGEYRRLACP